MCTRVACCIGVTARIHHHGGVATVDIGCWREDRGTCQPRATDGAQSAIAEGDIARAAIPYKTATWVFRKRKGDIGCLPHQQLGPAAGNSYCRRSGVYLISRIVSPCNGRDNSAVARTVFDGAAVEHQGVGRITQTIGIILPSHNRVVEQQIRCARA